MNSKKGFTRTPKFGVTPKGGGFTLIELMVVVTIIAILAAVVLALLGDAKNKGSDGAIKANLRNGLSQAEVFYNTNTSYSNAYASIALGTGVCSTSPIGGAKTLEPNITAAIKATGLSSFTRNAAGAAGTATCNDSPTGWAAEVPLKTSGQFWCVDSTGKSEQTTGTSISGAADVTCQ